MELEQAEKLGREIIKALLVRHVEKAEIAGSVRRRRPQVNDLDIVVIPKVSNCEVTFCATQVRMWGSIPTALKPLDLELVRGKDELLTFIRKRDNFAVDIYRATPQTWGTLLLIRTGSKMHNIKLCVRARELGLMLSAKSGVTHQGTVIASRTEEEIFKALQMDYVAPEQREVS